MQVTYIAVGPAVGPWVQQAGNTMQKAKLQVPECLVFVPDGNRRSAKAKGRPALRAHHDGLKNARTMIDAAFRRGIRNVVFWGASYGNLRDRNWMEVQQILRLFKQEVADRLGKDDKVRFTVCGGWRDFTDDAELLEMVETLERRTEKYEGPEYQQLTLLFGYDGRDDVVDAVRRIIEAGLKPEQVTQATFPLYLMSRCVPNVDLLVRTGEESGRPHWSKALLPWQMYDPELYFTPTFWPDFTFAEFDRVLIDWGTRRRMNGT